MEWQTRLPTSGKKRPNDAAHHDFRPRQSRSPAQLSVSHAEASGSSHMLTGNVGGDNIHGNVTYNTHYYNSHGTPGDPGLSNPDTYHNLSSVPSDLEKKEIFDKLYFPQLDDRLMNLRMARKRTCEWLLRRKDYQEWMDMDSKYLHAQHGLFWIRGNPGTGKSIAMKFLFHKMQNKIKRSRDGLVLSFFFNARGSDLEKSTLGLYRSLLFGLLSSHPSLLEVLDHCSRGQCLSILSSGWEQKHERFLQELCEKAVDLLAERKKRLYYYVDALDECPQTQIQEMVTYFEDIMTEAKSCNIRVCFSSRHYPRISIKTELIITLEREESHNNDIQTYIRSELRFDEHADQIEVDRLRDGIFQNSASIFLWVSLVVRQLNDVFHNDGRMDLVWKRLREIPRAAKETPASYGDLALYGLFQDVIMKDTRNIPDLVRLTQLIFCARRPLRPQEVFVALHRSYHEPFDAEKVNPDILSKHVLAISKGLAEVTRAKEPTVQFIHETVREFLGDGGLSTISKQSIQGDGNEMLKITCLDQIKALDSVAEHSELLANYRTWTSFRNKQDKDITVSQRKEFQKKVSRIFPFLEYATQYVLFHADSAAAQEMPQRLFLDSFPRHLWVPLHNLFETANSKRFGGPDTPILYILAGQGVNKLVRIAIQQRNYATLYQNEQCQTALHNAIYSGHLDTAWVLVGLDYRDRFPRLDQPKLKLSDCRKTLLKAIFDADDVVILFKVIQDFDVAYLKHNSGWANGDKGCDLILHECRSAAMIDCLVEHSMLPNFGLVQESDQNSADCVRDNYPTSDLFFIRRAIANHPEILTGTLWNGQWMLSYAVKKRFLTLVDLYFELMNSRGLATLNEILERAAMDGCLDSVKEIHSRGADLDYQDESGRTVLHQMFAGGRLRHASVQKQGDMCSTLEYLLSKSPKLGVSEDRDGNTPLTLIRDDIWGHEFRIVQDAAHLRALKLFVLTGTMTKTGFICSDHENPWVAIPWVPVRFAMKLGGKREITNLDARGSLGRTALSWCFSITHLPKDDDTPFNTRFNNPFYDPSRSAFRFETERDRGLYLLGFSHVDVNSRDDSGRTILEHLIRHPEPYGRYMGELTVAFFKSSALNVNLETSDRKSPLDLIISLYGTWPLEFGDIDAEWSMCFKNAKGTERQSKFSEGLLKTAQLLLATKRVDVSEQKRCLEKVPDDLRVLIVESIKEVEPDHHDWIAGDHVELDYDDWIVDDMSH